MKIVKLTAENFMRLVAVEISPKGNAILITGKNAAGKSSVLDAIMAVFCGKKYMPAKPIRDGQDHAEIVVETENYIIKRTFTAKGGGTVTVSNAEGMKASSPQGLLDKLVGEIAFEPMAFFKDSRDVKKQREQLLMLMKLVGLDFDDINAAITGVKEKRSAVKSSKETYDFEISQIEVPSDTPDELVSMTELTEKLTLATQLNEKHAKTISQIDATKQVIESGKQRLEHNLEEIKSLKSQLESAETFCATLNDELLQKHAAQEKLAETLEPLIDVAAISVHIADAETINVNVRKRIHSRELVVKAGEKSKEFALLGQDIKAWEAKKAERLAAVKMPIDKLSVNEETILYENIPLAQVNESMQLKIAMAISMALKPKLKVILMKGNDLDAESLEAVCKMAEEKGYQVWIEKVSDDKKNKTGFIIEDGSVVAADKEDAHAV